MNDCPNGEIRDLLPDLLHDRLSESDRMRVQGHVDACAECSAELALLRDLRVTLRRAPVVDVAAIAAVIPAYGTPVRRAWGGWRAAAAIAAIVVGGTSVAVLGRSDDRRTDVAQGVEAPSRGDSNVLAGGVSPAPPIAPADDSTGGRRQVAPAPASVADRESLAMSDGAIGDLSDVELATLLEEIETLDAVPSEDVEASSEIAESIPLEGTR